MAWPFFKGCDKYIQKHELCDFILFQLHGNELWDFKQNLIVLIRVLTLRMKNGTTLIWIHD